MIRMMTARQPTDCYEYVRNYYGVPAYVGMRVRIGGRMGTIVAVRGGGDQYIHVQIDNTPRHAPYHPTDGVEYLPPSAPGDGGGR